MKQKLQKGKLLDKNYDGVLSIDKFWKDYQEWLIRRNVKEYDTDGSG